jgi:hypothetical protein
MNARTAITPSRLRFSLFMFCSTASRLAATSPTSSSRCCSKYDFSPDVPLVDAIVCSSCFLVQTSNRRWLAGTIC